MTRFLFKGRERINEKLDKFKQSFKETQRRVFNKNHPLNLPSFLKHNEKKSTKVFSIDDDRDIKHNYTNVAQFSLPPSDKIELNFNESIIYPDFDEEVEFGLPGVSMNGKEETTLPINFTFHLTLS